MGPPRPFRGLKRPKGEIFRFRGPFWARLSPGEGREGPTGVQNTSSHCAWVGRIHIRCLGPLTDLYGTPRAPKRARLGLERSFWGPRRASESPGGPVFGPTVTGWSNRMTRIHIMCLGPYTDLSGTPGAPKRARLGLEMPFWGPRRASECPGGPVFGPTVTGWSNGMTRIHIMCLGP